MFWAMRKIILDSAQFMQDSFIIGELYANSQVLTKLCDVLVLHNVEAEYILIQAIYNPLKSITVAEDSFLFIRFWNVIAFFLIKNRRHDYHPIINCSVQGPQVFGNIVILQNNSLKPKHIMKRLYLCRNCIAQFYLFDRWLVLTCLFQPLLNSDIRVMFHIEFVIRVS